PEDTAPESAGSDELRDAEEQRTDRADRPAEEQAEAPGQPTEATYDAEGHAIEADSDGDDEPAETLASGDDALAAPLAHDEVASVSQPGAAAAAEQPSLVEDQEPTVRVRPGAAKRRGARKKRASVPSWDEIMFGSPKRD
ncbi:MAG: hypothetical protein Q4F67_03410, partial [Propionibacteriaceae bacterium]|nr:hypothetical protein [Propionibacteriaceae bacterium]